MDGEPVRIAIVGIGMWCKALATVIQKSGAFKIVTCFTRTKAKRDEFAATFRCDPETSYADVLRREDVEACKKNGVVLSVAHNQRKLSGYRKMKAMIQAGSLGKIITVETNFSHNGGVRVNPHEWGGDEGGGPGGAPKD